MGILGKLKSRAIGLMNKAEVKWCERKSFGEQYILCDQLTMAFLIRPKVAAKTILHQVKNNLLNLHLAYFLFIDGHGRLQSFPHRKIEPLDYLAKNEKCLVDQLLYGCEV